ncbi:hypothetical protein BOTCAL_0086g00050 [Botryotinia calthae]|uniref:Uncharacterized protein n=1 Tax=Botryotinia calthae TaxID=38488 RepID=A0A4Y8D9S1_9HELO|nr:hypothetical protein BOTCAL_0086g00050 [Botryotinia calthae]
MANENFTEKSGSRVQDNSLKTWENHRANGFRGKSNRLSKLRWERDLERSAYKSEELPAFVASRTDRHYKIKSRAAPDLHWQAFKREDCVPLPPSWKKNYPQYTCEAGASPRHRNSYTGASSRPPRTSVLNTQNLLKVRLQSKWKGHTITVHPFDWEEFKANEKDGHRKLTRAINFVKYWDQYVKDNPGYLKDIDQICESWFASPCAGDNPYHAKAMVGDARLQDYSSRRRQLQMEEEKKWWHMQRAKGRQEKSEKLSMVDNQIEELTLRVGRRQFSCNTSPSSNL